VIGRGDTDPVVPNWTHGKFDETKAARNRRTELMLIAPGC
jgi:flagellar motor protein MotB